MPTVQRLLKHRGASLLIGLVLLLPGCATTGLVNMWRDPELSARPIRSVYVVATRRDVARRRIMEDAFTQGLVERGLQATASYRQFPNELPDTLEVADAVRAGGYDAVLVVSPLGTRTVQTYVPGYVTTQVYTGWNRWRGRYESYLRDVESPGYIDTDEVVRHQVDLWSAADDGQLIWTATGNTLNPNSSREVSRELVHRVLDEMENQGLIPDD